VSSFKSLPWPVQAAAWIGLPFLLIALVLFVPSLLWKAPPSRQTAAPLPDQAECRRALATLSVPFVQNLGQKAPDVAYYTQTLGGTLFVTREGSMVYALPVRGSGEWQTLTENAVGRPSACGVQGMDPSAIGVSTFIGDDPSRWHSRVPVCDSLSLGESFPGVELRLRACAGAVERLFHVKPQADVEAIRMRLDAAMEVDADGSLRVKTPRGDLALSAPVAYQEGPQGRESVPVAYRVEGSEYGFQVGAYDCSRELVIDPLTQGVQASYLGGNQGDQAFGVTVASDGSVYVTGYTASTDLPGRSGGAQASLANAAGTQDAFVTRFNASLTSILQSTYLGGSNTDAANAIALDSSGNVYIAGYTASTDLAGSSGGAQASLGNAAGTYDAFVTRLSADLTTLSQSTYVGGNRNDFSYAMDIDSSGNVYIAGATASTEITGRAGGAQASLANAAGTDDAFATKLNAALTSISQTTYLGGSNSDQAKGIAFDSGGNVYITGHTSSTDLLGRTGGAQASLGNAAGTQDAFVAKLNASLSSLSQSSYLGGSGADVGQAIALASDGSVYITGNTVSTDLTGRAGGAQASWAGAVDADAFVSKFNTNLTSVLQSTYLGGANYDAGMAMVLDGSGGVYVAGISASSDLPGRTGGAQPALANVTGTYDGFVAFLNPSLTAIVQSSYLGGSQDDDQVNAIALDSHANVYLAGQVKSSDFPFTTGGAQSSHASPGDDDGFVARFPVDPGVLPAAGDDANQGLLEQAKAGRLGFLPYSTQGGTCFLTAVRRR